MRLLKAAIAIPTSFLATLSFAEDTPNIVYRVSPLAPDIVFKVGFSARGNDRDLLHYVSGTSVNQANEGYVSTSSSLINIRDISLACAQENPGRRLYIYYIRPTDNFYRVRDSIRFALNVLPNPEVRQQIYTIWHATQGEMYYFWSARAHISGNQIMGVRGFHSIGGSPYLGNLRPNPDYLYSYPEVSAYPMPIHNATVEAAFVAPAPHGVAFEPAGMVDMFPGQHFQRSSSSKSSQCFPLQRMSLPELRRKSVARLIASGILINSLSRQLLSVSGHDEL